MKIKYLLYLSLIVLMSCRKQTRFMRENEVEFIKVGFGGLWGAEDLYPDTYGNIVRLSDGALAKDIVDSLHAKNNKLDIADFIAATDFNTQFIFTFSFSYTGPDYVDVKRVLVKYDDKDNQINFKCTAHYTMPRGSSGNGECILVRMPKSVEAAKIKGVTKVASRDPILMGRRGPSCTEYTE